jgi:hypothetical protein
MEVIRRIDSKTAQSMIALDPVTPKTHILGPDDIVLSPLQVVDRSRASRASSRLGPFDDRESLIKKTGNADTMSHVSLN